MWLCALIGSSVLLSVIVVTVAFHETADAQEIDVGGPDPIRLGAAGVDVLVTNDGPAPATLTVRGGPLVNASSTTQGRLLISGGDTASEELPLALDGAASSKVHLSVTDWDRSTPLMGELQIVRAGNDGPTVASRRDVKVEAGADIPVDLKKWSVTSYESTLGFAARTYHTHVPLAEGRTCSTDAVASALLSTGDNTSRGRLTCAKGEHHALLSIGDPPVGNYSGQFVTSYGSLEVSARRSTLWVLPALWALVGLAVAAWRSWWIDKRRNVVRHEERLDGVLRLADRSQDAFRGATAGRPWTAYDVRPAVLQWRRSSGQRLRDPDADQSKVFEELRKSAGELAALLARWESTVPAAFQRLPANESGYASEASEYLPQLQSRLVAARSGRRPLATVEELAGLVEDVTGYEASVLTTARRLARVQTLVNENPTFEDAHDQELWKETRQGIRGVVVAAKKVNGVKGLAPIITKLEALEAELDKLPGRHRDLVAKPMAGMAEEEPASPDDEFAASLERAFGRRVHRWAADLLAFVLAAIVAISTALAQLYIGKAWGTWLDQLTIFIWAFGATALLSDVLQALLRILERQPTPAVN
jgi:hypothetical protein